ncbi:AI-2E family transporter [Lichenihabitans psoromatis]|uniref:AI-2E family transporter n=1 Tax=Lichenihabitans psoromatis TaxID=2528642 RepID=UPI001036EE15|nr:AI-2E family transporter [Lichenihabitans psoromatis]
MTLQRQVLIWFAFLALLIYALVMLSSVLLPFAAGLTLGYLLDPLAERLERLGLGRLGATLLLLALFVLLLVLIVLMLVPILAHQFASLIENLPGFAVKLQQLVTEQGTRLVNGYGGETLRKFGLSGGLSPSDFQNSIGSVVGQGSNYLVGVLKSLWSGGTALLSLLSLMIVTPVVAFYILLDWKSMIAAIDGWVPLAHREDVRQIARDIDAAFAGFARGQSIVCIFLGLWYGIGLTLVGLNFGFLIGITGGFLSFIPYVGSLAVLLFAVAVALVQSWPDWTLVALTVGVVTTGQFLEGNILSPNLVGASVGLHPVWVMFALLAFGALFGFTGLIIAVPLAAAAGVLARFALRKYLVSPLYTGEPDETIAGRIPKALRREA